MAAETNFRVGIIGGGYAEFNLARLLDVHLDVTLIEAPESWHPVPEPFSPMQHDLNLRQLST